MNSKTLFLPFLLFGIMLFMSCSEDNNDPLKVSDLSTKSISQESNAKGRFDNTPFQWDYFFSTDSSQERSDEVIVYPVKVQDSDTILTASTVQNRSSRSSYSNDRNDSEPSRSSRVIGGQGGSRRSSDYSNNTSTSTILISDPNIIYVGAAFPESEFGRNFSKELLYPRNPIEISTSFPDCYMGEINKETGSFGYKKFMKEVLNSTEYKNFLHNGGRESLDFQCTEYFSYSDIEKAFSSNAGLAKIFSSKVRTNSQKTNIKSRLLGQLISKNFTVTMEVPINGFFKDKSRDISEENPVYVRSISYGKIALLSVESEYSFEEVKKSVEAGIKWKIFNAGGGYSTKDIEILQKSTITLYLISDDTNGNANQFFSSLDDIKNAFQLNYTDANIGLPILCKGYYTKNNSIFILTTSSYSGRGSERGSGRGGSERGSGSRNYTSSRR